MIVGSPCYLDFLGGRGSLSDEQSLVHARFVSLVHAGFLSLVHARSLCMLGTANS